uniref:Uncharacterized protein n=1 Tax=Tanacetum cinerariifolium TaxID=118510 RepID=A0A699UU79_TANCI|nr:hypothetical protein [Tanacetum cinerariifolium]
MLLLVVQNKIFNLKGEDIVNLAATLFAGKKVDEEPGKVRWWKGIRGRPSTASADNMLCHILFYSLR